MPLDFRDAAKRHWKDAEYLLEDERFAANADHLFGMSAECALKAVMLSLGMQMVGNMPEKDVCETHQPVVGPVRNICK